MVHQKEIEDACYDICNSVRTAFEECSSHYEAVGNIFAAFFHDLVVHFTGIVIHRAAVYDYGNTIQFPWVNKAYASTPFRYGNSQLFRQLEEKGYYSAINQFAIIPVAIGQSIPLGYRQKRVLDKFLKIFTHRQMWTEFYLPERAAQMNYLGLVIVEICKKHEIKDSAVVRENWIQYVFGHTTEKQMSIPHKGVLVGTRNNLHNRKLALNYMQQEKKVIGFTHGEINNEVLDEPVYGYSDKSLCTTLVEYGTFSSVKALHPAIIPPENTVRRNSEVIRRFYKPSNKIEYKSLADSRVLLIPTMYQQNYLYGPKHAYETEKYYQWHRSIEKCVPSLTIKMHPKTRIEPSFDCNVDYRQLETCISEYDVLVLDYFATSAVLAIFSDKPVIYFNIGLRTMDGEFHRDLESRCTLVNVDFEENWDDQILLGLSEYESEKKTCSNVELAKYALCDHDEFSMSKVIIDIITS
jgi:hypothetical protein